MRSAPLAACLMVLCGGAAAQLQWFSRTPATQPPPRLSAAMAWDGQQVILFGGGNHPWQSTQVFDDTWAWDGQTWRQQAPTMRPTARLGHAMAFDPVRGRVVLFGGHNPSTTFDDTWEWDGTTWAPVFAASYPRGMARPSLVFDAARGRLVLTGYLYANASRYETWEWSAGHWLNRTTLPTPTPEYGAVQAAWDPNTRTTLALDCSVTGSPQRHRALTWAFDGAAWSQLSVANLPIGRWDFQLVSDTVRSRVVMFGGFDSPTQTKRSDTWEWDGSSWLQPNLTLNPGPRQYATLGYHEGLGRVVLFGDGGGTWELYNPNQARFSTFGTGCTGSAGVPSLAAASGSRPWIGANLVTELRNLPSGNPAFVFLGFSRTFWGVIPLPRDLGFLGAAGCALRVAADVTVPVPNLGGTARFTLAIPDDPFLLGVEFFLQGWVVDPPANALGITVSNGCEARIGAR